jgi:hypothetical protein
VLSVAQALVAHGSSSLSADTSNRGRGLVVAHQVGAVRGDELNSSERQPSSEPNGVLASASYEGESDQP